MKTSASLHSAAAAAAVAVMLAAGAPTASAQTYFGIGAGPSRINIDCTGTLTCDKTDVGFKLYGGLNVSGPWALELTYLDWGRAEAGFAAAPGGGANDLKTRVRGLALAGAYTFPLAMASCAARLGVGYNRATTDTTLAGVPASANHNYTAPYYGFGCAFPVMPSLAVTVDLDFSRAKYTVADKANLQLLTVGVRF